MSKEYKEFLPEVLPEVKGCPVPVAIKAIREAVREFCEKTWVWQEVVDYTITEDEVEIIVDIPTGSRLVSIRYLLDEDGNEKGIDSHYFIRAQTVGATEFEVQSEFEQEESEEYEARVVLKPSEDSTTCPDFLYNDYAEVIGKGALAKLLMSSKAIWGEPNLSMFYRQEFKKAIANTRIYLAKGYTQKSLKVKMRRFV